MCPWGPRLFSPGSRLTPVTGLLDIHMKARDGHVTGWRQLLALSCLIAALCLAFRMGRVVPVWSILVALWGLLRIGRGSVLVRQSFTWSNRR